MSSTITELDAVNLIKRGLEAEVKEILTEEIIKEHMDSLEADLRAKLKPIIERVTLNRIGHFKNMMAFRDEVHLHVEIKERTK